LEERCTAQAKFTHLLEEDFAFDLFFHGAPWLRVAVACRAHRREVSRIVPDLLVEAERIVPLNAKPIDFLWDLSEPETFLKGRG